MPKNERLRQQRILRNWRQQDVADQLGISLVTMQRWERGIQQPSAYYRVKLCALFGKSTQELGLLEALPSPLPAEHEAEGAVQPDVTPSREIALWTVPHARNPHFTGRDDLLNQLMQQFSPQETARQTSIRQAALTQSHAIKGLGGVGKTQIAVEYAYRSHEQGRYSHTLWINAASEEAILASFAALADFLPTVASTDQPDQRRLVSAAIGWLEQCPHPWLLIFDNADDFSFIPSYLPSRGNGSILFTTRANAVGALASSVEVDCMSLMEGTLLLLRRAQREASASTDEIDEATNIVVALAQFPLALDQAGAYIEETGCSLHDYFQLYQKHRYALLARRGKQAMYYPESVATTWSLSFEHVAKKNPAAAELLRLCAFLAPDHIPEELLTEGAAHWPSLLQEAVADRLSLNQVLETLLSFSLVKRLSEDRLLSLHRLVQVVQIEAMEQEEQRQWAERVVRAVNSIFPRDPQDEVKTWPQCQRYLEQAQACDTLIQEYQIQFPEAANVLDRTGTYLRERALYTLAEPLFQQALHMREQLLGAEHLDTAESLNNLAHLCYKQGRYAQAEPLYLRALHIREQQWGAEHLDIASTLHGLGNLYHQQDRYVQAEHFFQRALHIREQQLGPEHPQVAYPLNSLALAYYKQGKYAQAELLYQRVLRIREQQLGAEHPDMANSLTLLGLLYFRLGRYAQAEPLYLRALRIREQQLGAEHPDMVYPLINLGNLYYRQGRYEQAELPYQRALHITEQQVGPEHLLSAFPLTGLGTLYQKQGKYAQGEPLLLQALHIREQQLGPEHSQLAYPLHGLANLYSQQGMYGQAEPLYQRALSIREQQLGPEHLEVADVLHDFADFQQKQGRTSKAIFLYQRALRIREKVLGAEHPITIDTRKCLDRVVPPG